jgi:hypothetical protein
MIVDTRTVPEISIDVNMSIPGVRPMSLHELPALEQSPAVACCVPLASDVLSVTGAEVLSRQFAALADPVRLRTVSLRAMECGVDARTAVHNSHYALW